MPVAKTLLRSFAAMTIVAAVVIAQPPRGDAVFSHVATGVPVVKAYLLSAAEENCFSRTDSARTFFWTAWDQNSSLNKAVITGSMDNLAWGPVPENADDCQATVSPKSEDRSC
jgi:hypothetical protein